MWPPGPDAPWHSPPKVSHTWTDHGQCGLGWGAREVGSGVPRSRAHGLGDHGQAERESRRATPSSMETSLPLSSPSALSSLSTVSNSRHPRLRMSLSLSGPLTDLCPRRSSRPGSARTSFHGWTEGHPLRVLLDRSLLLVVLQLRWRMTLQVYRTGRRLPSPWRHHLGRCNLKSSARTSGDSFLMELPNASRDRSATCFRTNDSTRAGSTWLTSRSTHPAPV